MYSKKLFIVLGLITSLTSGCGVSPVILMGGAIISAFVVGGQGGGGGSDGVGGSSGTSILAQGRCWGAAAKLKLLKSGELLQSTETASTGRYTFPINATGSYTVQAESKDTGFKFSPGSSTLTVSSLQVSPLTIPDFFAAQTGYAGIALVISGSASGVVGHANQGGVLMGTLTPNDSGIAVNGELRAGDYVFYIFVNAIKKTEITVNVKDGEVTQINYNRDDNVLVTPTPTPTPTATPTPTPTPSTPDTTAPTSPSIAINGGIASTNARNGTLNLSARDNVGVTGYYFSETGTTPTASASGWVTVTSSTNYLSNPSPIVTLSDGEGTKTVYAWFKDAAGNISERASDDIVYVVPPTTAGVQPSDGSTNVGAGKTIRVTFSKAMDATTITTSTLTLKQGETSVSTSISYDSSTKIATVTPTSPLSLNTTYTETVTTGVKDSLGTAFASAVTVTFTTRASSSGISAGNGFTLAYTAAGVVWAWGSSGDGQLGNGANVTPQDPVQVLNLTDVTALSAGNAHVLARKSDGTVWAWGDNQYGQLGDGTTTDRNTPVQVSGLTNVTAVAAGDNFSLALKSDGTVWAWGLNTGYQLGDETQTQRTTPVQVLRSAFSGGGSLTNVSAIAAGDRFAIALITGGTVMVWGTDPVSGGGTATRATTVPELTGVSAIAAGGTHELYLKTDGTVWAKAKNDYGQLGDGTNVNSANAVQVSGLTGITAIAAGYRHSMALKNDGTLWTWGGNDYGQLGDGTTTNRNTPVQITGISNISQIEGGNAHSLVKTTGGAVWGFGDNAQFQLDSTQTRRTSPVVTSY